MTRAVCSSFGFKKSDIVGGTFGGEVSDASVHGVRDSRGSRCVGGGCCWSADVCEDGIDDSGRDGEVAWVEVLPSCACCPHVVARVVVIRAVIAIAFQKKSDDWVEWQASRSDAAGRVGAGHESNPPLPEPRGS